MIFAEDEHSPKEKELIELCRQEKGKNRRVLVYTTYTGKHDTTSRLKRLLTDAGLKTAVLRSSVATDRREEWILDQVDLGIDVLVCNPELVKTGLDLLEFPTLAFLQSGYNPNPLIETRMRVQVFGFRGYSKNSRFTRRLIEYFLDILWNQRLVLSSCFLSGG